MAHPYWPLFDLRVRTPLLELRQPTDDDLSALARVAATGVHDPAWTPFLHDWTAQPSPQLERGVLQWGWRARAEWQVDAWRLTTAVVVDGEVVGVQDLSGQQFPDRRVCATGSWLGREHQGRGIGREMRAAIVHLAFAGLGALRCESGYWHDNEPSRRVSAGLGYVENGDHLLLRRGKRDRQVDVKLERHAWEQRRRHDIEIVGLEPCLPLFGLGPDLEPLEAGTHEDSAGEARAALGA